MDTVHTPLLLLKDVPGPLLFKKSSKTDSVFLTGVLQHYSLKKETKRLNSLLACVWEHTALNTLLATRPQYGLSHNNVSYTFSGFSDIPSGPYLLLGGVFLSPKWSLPISGKEPWTAAPSKPKRAVYKTWNQDGRLHALQNPTNLASSWTICSSKITNQFPAK